ncbi:MAG: ABC transporter ATP-binding protein [Anaerolinea sp.]|nr:ABC transporter ATP-binding protein [Anaerolinea sp.]
MALLEAIGLTKRFGSLVAVDDVSLVVQPGEAYGLVGPDGAGKTTVMRLLVGALSLDAGSVAILGQDLARHPEQARSSVGYLPQRFSLYHDLTVGENLAFFGSVRGIDRKTLTGRAAELLAFVGLTGFENRLAGVLSGGMKQKLGLACALVHRPSLLLLDEPTSGVDPITRQDFWQLIIRLLGDGAGVVVSTPYMDEAIRCSILGFMAAGRILTTGAPRSLLAPLAGRVLELRAEPRALAHQLCQADPDVEDVAQFGELLHLRLRGAAVFSGLQDGQATQLRLSSALAAGGVQVLGLRAIAPSLEDVFIATLQATALEARHE